MEVKQLNIPTQDVPAILRRLNQDELLLMRDILAGLVTNDYQAGRIKCLLRTPDQLIDVTMSVAKLAQNGLATLPTARPRLTDTGKDRLLREYCR